MGSILDGFQKCKSFDSFLFTISGHAATINFTTNGVETPDCGLIANAGIWRANGNLTGDLSNSNYENIIRIEAEAGNEVRKYVLTIMLSTYVS